MSGLPSLPLDPAFFAGDPYPVYRRLRAERPLFRHEERGFWVATRHADVVAVSRDPQRFVSSRGILLSDLERSVTGRESIIYMDPPAHRKFRRLVQPALGRSRVRALELAVRKLAAGLLDAFEPGRAVDFIDAFASPLPVLVIADLLGIPDTDRRTFRRWSDAAIAAATQPTPETVTQIGEMLAYLGDVARERRARPGDDLISELARAQVDGDLLDEHDLVMFCLTLLVAGNETTRNLIANGAILLDAHPEQREHLAAHPEAVAGGVEEMLRFEGPVIGFLRTAAQDARLGGECLRAGERVLMLYAAANRDEAVFGTTSEHFDVRRHPNDHLAFGRGEHFCLGAALARLEARVAFQELLARFPRFRLGGPPARTRSSIVRGVEALDLLPA